MLLTWYRMAQDDDFSCVMRYMTVGHSADNSDFKSQAACLQSPFNFMR